MLVKIYNTGSPDTSRVPIWTCLITEIVHYAGYRQLESKYFTTKYANVCMICMKCIILTMKMQQSYADDLERQNEQLRR